MEHDGEKPTHTLSSEQRAQRVVPDIPPFTDLAVTLMLWVSAIAIIAVLMVVAFRC